MYLFQLGKSSKSHPKESVKGLGGELFGLLCHAGEVLVLHRHAGNGHCDNPLR